MKYASYITRGPVDPAFPNLPGPIQNINLINLNLGETKGLGIRLRSEVAHSDGRFRPLHVDRKRHLLRPVRHLEPGRQLRRRRRHDQSPRPAASCRASRAISRSTGRAARGTSCWRRTTRRATTTCRAPSTAIRVASAAYTTYDLQGTYSQLKAWRFTLGVRNLFDRDPPYSNAGGQTGFQSGYDNQYGDPRGRFIYGRVTYLMQ